MESADERRILHQPLSWNSTRAVQIFTLSDYALCRTFSVIPQNARDSWAAVIAPWFKQSVSKPIRSVFMRPWIGWMLWGGLAVVGLAGNVLATEPPVTGVTFSPDGKQAIVCSQLGIQCYAWPELKLLDTLPCDFPNLHCLAFSPEGSRLAVAGGIPSEEGLVQVFAWPTGEPVGKYDRHRDSVRAVSWLGEDCLLSASIDREIHQICLNSQSKFTSTVRFQGHSRSVDALCLLKDGKTLVSAGVDQSLRVWDIQSTELIRSLNQHTRPVVGLALRPSDARLPMVASAASDRSIRFWQPTIGRMVRYIRLEVEPLAIAWLNDGNHLAAACTDGQVRIVDADNVRLVRTIPGVRGWAYSLAVHPSDGSLLVGGSDGQLLRLIP